MTASDDITAAHDDVVRSRAQMADTVAQLEARVTGQMDAVKAKLDVVQMIRDNPWTSIAVAAGVGAAISASGADKKAAAAAVSGAKDAAQAAATKAREVGQATLEAAQGAPAQAQSAAHAARRGLAGYLDTFAASLVVGVIERLRSGEKGTDAKA